MLSLLVGIQGEHTRLTSRMTRGSERQSSTSPIGVLWRSVYAVKRAKTRTMWLLPLFLASHRQTGSNPPGRITGTTAMWIALNPRRYGELARIEPFESEGEVSCCRS